MPKKFLILVAAVFIAAASQAQTVVNGAGSTFVYPLFSKWSEEYHKMKPDIQINYQSIGSGGGIQQLIAGTVNIGASDAPLTDQQTATAEKAHGPVLHIPETMGGVVMMYNIPGVNQTLKFDGPTIADIYLGKIKSWDDQRLKDLNPGVNFPSTPIIPVHRADGSGTTYIFADYLSKISSDWKNQVGVSTSLNWPVGLGAKGSEGVAGQVERTPGAIGYADLIYALQNNISYGDVKNAAGVYIHPSLDGVTAAAAAAAKSFPKDLRFSITDAPGKASYPISSATWLLVFENQTDYASGKASVEFIHWVITNGQKYCADLDYAPIPKQLEKLDLVKLSLIRYNGKKLLK
ncbi:MAG TPA: phosphate ABC transporter substrate-binding protein PstS [Candidatus Kryptonia bacterium]